MASYTYATDTPHCHVGTWERVRFQAGTLHKRYGLKSKHYSRSLMGTEMRDARVWLECNQLKSGRVILLRALWRAAGGQMYAPDVDDVLYRTDANGTCIHEGYSDPTDTLYYRVMHEVRNVLRITWKAGNRALPDCAITAYRDWHYAGLNKAPTCIQTADELVEWMDRGDDWVGVWF